MADEISVGSVSVTVVPDARGFSGKLRAELRDLPDIKIAVKLDDAVANLQLDALDAKIHAISGDDVRIHVDLDGTALAEGQTALLDLNEAATVAGAGLASLAASVEGMVATVDTAAADLDVASGALADVAAGAETAGAGAATSATSFSALGAAILAVIFLAGPIVSVLTPAIAGLVTVVGALGAGFTVAAIAIVPLVKAVAAFRKEQLTPTAANLAALKASLQGMPGAGRAMVLFVATKLYPAFHKLQQAAERGLFPGLLKGLQALTPLFRPLTAFVGSLAHTLGGLAASAGKALNDKFWRGFFKFVTATAGPTLKTFAKIIGNVARGFASMLEGFGPLSKGIGRAIEELSRSFANWAAGKGFQDFLAYVEKNGPPFAKLIGGVLVLVVHLLAAFAPLGPVLVTITSAIVGFLDKLSPTEILLIVGAIGGLAAGFVGVAAAVAAVATLIITHWSGIKGFFVGIGHWFAGPFVGFFTRMASDIASITRDLGHGMKSVWDGDKTAAAAVGRWFSGPFVRFFAAAGRGTRDELAKLLTFFQSLPRRIVSAFGDATKILYNVGKQIVAGLWSGVKDAWHGFTSGLHSLVSHIPFVHGSPALVETAPRLLSAVGEMVVTSLSDGVKKKWPSVVDVLHAAGGSVPQAVAAGIKAGSSAVDTQLKALTSKIDKQITKVKSRISSLQSAEKSMAASIAAAITSPASLSSFTYQGNITDPVKGGLIPGTAPGRQVESFFNSGARNVSRFIHALDHLRHLGLSDAVVDQIAQLGATPQAFQVIHDLEAGSPHAVKAEIGRINSDQHRITALASKFGASQAQAQYGVKLDRNTKALDALTREVKALRHGSKPAVSHVAKARGRG